MKIPVTRYHIEAGSRESIHSCALALAILDVVKPNIGVLVTSNHWIALYRSGYPMIKIPQTPEIAKIVRAFDSGEKVEPCEVSLPIPEHLIAVR